MIRKAVGLVVALILALIVWSVPVAAQPPPPPACHVFYGEVTIDASPATDGTEVTAHIGDLSWSITTSGGKYGYDPLFLIPLDDPATSGKDGGEDGDEITFKVDGEAAATYTFQTYAVTELNLSISTTGVTYYTLVVDVSPTGAGTVDLSPGASGNQYESGTPVALTANPASGYVFDHWSGDLSGSTNPTSITMNGNKSVTAHFNEISAVQYTLTISSAEGGSVTTPGEGTFDYDAGEVVELVASPDDGYEFDEWTGDTGTVDDVDDTTTTITMDADKSIKAVFTAVVPGISPARFSASNLRLSPQEVQPDQQVEISISMANNGGTTGSRTVILYINGDREDSSTISLAPGSAQDVVFTLSKSIPGTYDVLLEGLPSQFMVIAAPATGSPGGLGTGAIIGIVAGVVVVIAVVGFLLVRRRRRYG